MSKAVRYDFSKLWIQIFCILFVVYYILNIMFPTDYSLNAVNEKRLFPQIAAAALTFFSILVSIKNRKYLWQSRPIRAHIVLFVLACLYILYPMSIGTNLKYVSRTYMGIITMAATFSLYLDARQKKTIHNAIFLIYFFQILFCFSSLIADHQAFTASTDLQFDSNAGFMLISCLPLALVLPVKKLRLYVYLLLVVGCLYSGQRSAALAAIASAPFCLWYLKKDITKRDIVLLVIIGLALLVPVLKYAIENIQLRTETDLEKGALGSGRLIFWGIIINDFFKKDILHILFGNGTDSVATLLEATYGLKIGAHNGWLDILYTFGFTGVALYASIFITLLKENKRNKKLVPEFRNIYFILFVIFFFKATTSHGYFDASFIPFLMTISIVEGEKFRKLKK